MGEFPGDAADAFIAYARAKDRSQDGGRPARAFSRRKPERVSTTALGLRKEALDTFESALRVM